MLKLRHSKLLLQRTALKIGDFCGVEFLVWFEIIVFFLAIQIKLLLKIDILNNLTYSNINYQDLTQNTLIKKIQIGIFYWTYWTSIDKLSIKSVGKTEKKNVIQNENILNVQ